MAVFVDISGDKDVLRMFERAADGIHEVAQMDLFAGSTLPYAYGIETGRHRGGRLARRAGGAYMLRDAVNDTVRQAPAMLAERIIDGPRPARAAMLAIGDTVVNRAKARTPVVSGALRDSIQRFLGG